MLNVKEDHEFEQMNVSAGVKKHGDKAIAAVIQEYEQLRDLETVLPMHTNSLFFFKNKRHSN